MKETFDVVRPKCSSANRIDTGFASLLQSLISSRGFLTVQPSTGRKELVMEILDEGKKCYLFAETFRKQISDLREVS